MITATEWRNLTGVTRTSLESKNFKAIEASLKVFEKGPSKGNLETIISAVAAWKKQKVEKFSKLEPDPAKKGGATLWDRSKRNQPVTLLEVTTRPLTFLRDEIVRTGQIYHMFPSMEAGWVAGGHSQNCYAYAMKCRDLDDCHGDPIPGGYEGKNQGPGADLVDYYKRLIAGVIQDGAKQNVDILVAATVKGFDADNASIEDAYLPDPRDGHYRAVIIAAGTGFHWLRCDEATGFWTHKNGPNNLPEGTVDDEFEQKPVAITDGVLTTMLESPFHSRYGSLDHQFHYLACFYVPDDGMDVFRQPFPAPAYKGDSWWTPPKLNKIIDDASV